MSSHYSILLLTPNVAYHSAARIVFFLEKRFTGQIIAYTFIDTLSPLIQRLLLLLVVLSVCSHQRYQIMQSKDSYGTHLLHVSVER